MSKEQKKVKRRFKLNRKLGFSILALTLGGLYLYLLKDSVSGNARLNNAGSFVSFEKTGILMNYDYNTNVECFTNDNGFFLCSKDGIKYVNLQGETKWDYPHTMRTPLLTGEGEFAAAAEANGNILNVFNEDGPVYSVNFDVDMAIANFSINDSGYCSVIVKSGNYYKLYVYNYRGVLCLEQDYEERNIYPIASDISDDGKILAVSNLDVSGGEIGSSIAFHYINDSDKENEADGLFGTSPFYPGRFIVKLIFMEGNELLSVSDSAVTGFSVGLNNDLSVSWDYEIGNKISYVATLNKKTFAIGLGERMVNKEAWAEGSLLFYSIDGAFISDYSTGSAITYLSGGSSALLAATGGLGRSFIAFNDKGKILWEHTVTQDVTQIHFLGKTDRIVLITPNHLEVLERTKVFRKPEGEDDFLDDIYIEEEQDQKPNRNDGTTDMTEPMDYLNIPIPRETTVPGDQSQEDGSDIEDEPADDTQDSGDDAHSENDAGTDKETEDDS